MKISVLANLYGQKTLDEALSIPERYIRDEKSKCVALGEIGLDRLRGPALETQIKFLHALLALAQERKGYANKENSKFTDQIRSLIEKYRR